MLMCFYVIPGHALAFVSVNNSDFNITTTQQQRPKQATPYHINIISHIITSIHHIITRIIYGSILHDPAGNIIPRSGHLSSTSAASRGEYPNRQPNC